MSRKSQRSTHLCGTGTYKPGDQPPEGYMDWHEWAKVQHRSGMRQFRRECCGKWMFQHQACPHSKNVEDV